MKVKMPKGTKCMANGGSTGDPTPRKVSAVPQGYQPYKKEGNRQLYYTEKQIGQAQKSGNQGGPGYEKFLKQQLSAGVSPEQLASKGYIDQSQIETYRPYHKKDIVYTEPETIQPQKTPIPLDVDKQINRKDVSVGTMPYKSYSYPDVNGGYSQATTRHFDPGTNREIDPLKSYAGGNYSPSYLYDEKDERGLPAYGTERNRSLSSGSMVKDPNYKADTKNAVVNTVDQFASGGKIPNKSKWLQHLVDGEYVQGPAAGTTDTQSVSSQRSNINKTGSIGDKVGAGMGWFGYANQAQQMVRGNINKDEVVDPKTGQVYSSAKTNEGKIIDSTATPFHETFMKNMKSGNDFKKGESIAAVALGTPGLQRTSNFINYDPKQQKGNRLSFKKNIFSDTDYDQEKSRINQEQDVQDAMAQRDAGNTDYTSTPMYKKDGGDISSTAKRWIEGKSGGGDIKGKGGPKTDSIPSKLEPGGFVVPAENADKAQEIRDKYFPGTKGKANLKQKGGSSVMVSNGEHYFTPDECVVLKKKGVDLYDLAPNADKDDNDKKNGGDVDSMMDAHNTKHLNKRIAEIGREKAIKEYNDIFNDKS